MENSFFPKWERFKANIQQGKWIKRVTTSQEDSSSTNIREILECIESNSLPNERRPVRPVQSLQISCIFNVQYFTDLRVSISCIRVTLKV